MRAVRCNEGRIEVTEQPSPSGAGERIRIRSAGICGTDVSMWKAGFPLTVTLGHEFAGLRDDGSAVVVLEGRTKPTAESPRNALVRALGAPSGSSAESLRVELLLLLPNDEVRALRELQRRAHREAVQILSWERQDERTLRLEIGCVRPVALMPTQ